MQRQGEGEEKQDVLDARQYHERQAWDRIPEGAVRVDGAWSTGSQEILDGPYMTIEQNPFRDIPQGAVRRRFDDTSNAGNRHREESIEERALRRRRREAVVVGRDGEPIDLAI